MNNQFLASTSMAALQAPSQFALMTPTFSASAAVPQVAVPQTGNGAAITASIVADEMAMQHARPLWRNGEKTFPYKVYDMLEFAESSGNTNICSWLPSGNSFVIHDRKLFTEVILPRFFLHKKWRSFVSIYFAAIQTTARLVHLLFRPTRSPSPLSPFSHDRPVNSTFGVSNVTSASLSLTPIVTHSSSVGT